MPNAFSWLPDLVYFDDYQNLWERYLEAIYEIFKQDFVLSKPIFRGKRLGLKRYPITAGKESTFWHMISTGEKEEDRIPDFRRCERIGWPRPTIENDSNPAVKCWTSEVKQENRITIWIEEHDYVVILAERKGYILPWTAFVVTHNHRRRKLQKAYEKCKSTAKNS